MVLYKIEKFELYLWKRDEEGLDKIVGVKTMMKSIVKVFQVEEIIVEKKNLLSNVLYESNHDQLTTKAKQIITIKGMCLKFNAL